MAHTCPKCDQMCYCNGDWDDALTCTDDPFCNHYLNPLCHDDEDYEDWEDEE